MVLMQQVSHQFFIACLYYTTDRASVPLCGYGLIIANQISS